MVYIEIYHFECNFCDLLATIYLILGLISFVWLIACKFLSYITEKKTIKKEIKKVSNIFRMTLLLSIMMVLVFLLSILGMTIGINGDKNDKNPDGYVYLHTGNTTEDIHIGHQEVIDLCRGQKYGEPINTTFRNFKVSCKELFIGCGAVNCECWVVDYEMS